MTAESSMALSSVAEVSSVVLDHYYLISSMTICSMHFKHYGLLSTILGLFPITPELDFLQDAGFVLCSSKSLFSFLFCTLKVELRAC
jgi:hypothetical protein